MTTEQLRYCLYVNLINPDQPIIAGDKAGFIIQYNLNGSNTDGSFTVHDSNSLFSPYIILPIAQENKYLGIFLFYHGIAWRVYSLELPH